MGSLPSGPPTMVHGGNFDLREITVGSSLYLPVHVKGGIFTAGDPHALQGNGEVTGTTIECNIEAILQFIVHKATGLKDIAWLKPDADEMSEQDWREWSAKSFMLFLPQWSVRRRQPTPDDLLRPLT